MKERKEKKKKINVPVNPLSPSIFYNGSKANYTEKLCVFLDIIAFVRQLAIISLKINEIFSLALLANHFYKYNLLPNK